MQATVEGVLRLPGGLGPQPPLDAEARLGRHRHHAAVTHVSDRPGEGVDELHRLGGELHQQGLVLLRLGEEGLELFPPLGVEVLEHLLVDLVEHPAGGPAERAGAGDGAAE